MKKYKYILLDIKQNKKYTFYENKIINLSGNYWLFSNIKLLKKEWKLLDIKCIK